MEHADPERYFTDRQGPWERQANGCWLLLRDAAFVREQALRLHLGRHVSWTVSR